MHRARSTSSSGAASLPHTRGDAPIACRSPAGGCAFTPHAWGCTAPTEAALAAREVYPTRVGMHRRRRGRLVAVSRLPHTRGDAPRLGKPGRIPLAFTPHAWGCTDVDPEFPAPDDVYPTRVGMHRRSSPRPARRACLPHTRGDAPPGRRSATWRTEFTPHAWGCTGVEADRRTLGPVYPTRVGMHRGPTMSRPEFCGLPHTRGDAPWPG